MDGNVFMANKVPKGEYHFTILYQELSFSKMVILERESTCPEDIKACREVHSGLEKCQKVNATS